jgi:mannitol/fructose-specific phosphotransferase system IIA component (Ntr-type)
MPAIEITQHCVVEHCLPKLKGETKEDVISELVDRFVASGAVQEDDAADLIAEILAREEEGTTGIGKGVAMPHSRASSVVSETLIAVGLHADGVEFEATDGSPVHVVFLIASSDPEEYLGVAGRIARVARDDVEMKALQRQKTAKSVRKFLEESWSPANA